MTTDDVVSALVRDLKPVVPLRAASVRAWHWGFLAAVTGGMTVAVFGLRSDLAATASTLSFRVQAVLLLVATTMASGAALVFAIPGEHLSRIRRAAPIAAALTWGAWLLTKLASAVGSSSTAWALDSGWGCVVKAMTIAAVPGTALMLMVGRGASVDPRRAVAYAALAAAGVGALGVEFTCPNPEAIHQLVWHFGPLAVLPLVAALVGAPMFARWMRRRMEPRL
ncbi:MAG: NrsF family protein [Candidatus Limnocylindria bacterium]